MEATPLSPLAEKGKREPRIKNGELTDPDIVSSVREWIDSDNTQWSNEYVSRYALLDRAKQATALKELLPEEIALALEDLVEEAKLQRIFTLMQMNRSIVSSKVWVDVMDISLDEAQEEKALITSAYRKVA